MDIRKLYKISNYTAIFYCSFIYFIFILISALRKPLSTYVLTEWLINYSAGFTRRGLLGAIITRYIDVSIRLSTINFTTKCTFIMLLCIYIVYTFKYRRYNAIPTILLISPVLVIFPLYDNSALGRIELFGFFVTILNAYLIRLCFESVNMSPNHIRSALCNRRILIILIAIIPTVILSFMMFINEATFFLILPINFLLTFLFLFNTIPQKKKLFYSMFVTALVYLPVWLSLLALSLYGNGGSGNASAICENIKSVFPDLVKYDCHDIRGSVLLFHQKSTIENMIFTLGKIRYHLLDYFLYGFIGVFLSVITIICLFRLFLVTHNDNAYPKLLPAIAYFFIVPVLCMLPLFIIGMDWGRWFFVANMHLTLVFFILIDTKTFTSLQLPIPECHTVETLGRTTNYFLVRLSSVCLFPLILVLLGLKMPHFDPGVVNFLSPLAYEIISPYYKGDDVKTYEGLKALAERGDARAQYNLALIYQNGYGVPQDDPQAARWLRKAAEQGLAPAQYNLGVMYVNGEGVPKDEAEAVKWYRKAAEQRHANAQNQLGYMYANGEGVPKDEAEAVKWYRKAAEQRHANAQNQLGYMYAKGQGVSKDFVLAHMWFDLAAAQGESHAQKNREIIAAAMTSAQIADAQRLAREWKPKSQD